MFVSPAPAPGSSPHLRKSGSRAVVSDPDDELENGVEDGHLHSMEYDLKIATIPMGTVAIMPSPTLLWRFKLLLLFIWGFSCSKIGWVAVMRMSLDLRDLFLYEAFLYYNPLLLVTMMVWLWGVNLWVFSQSNVNYAKIFDLDLNHLTHREIWKVVVVNFFLNVSNDDKMLLNLELWDRKNKLASNIPIWNFLFGFFIVFGDLILKLCATWMTIIVPTSMTAYLYLYSHGEVSLAASQPVLLYFAVVMILIFPFDIFYFQSRYYLLRALSRIVLPLQAITFSDFFLADILTSMSKVLSDLERSVCRMVHRQVATIAWFEADSVCGSHSVAIPVVLVLPYLFRFFQCIRQYKDTGQKSTLFNALKYSTAIPVIFLSALKYHVLPDRWTNFYRPLWLFSSFLNSLYSFYWDVAQDWDLSGFTRIFKFNKPNLCSHLFYGRTWVYFWVIGSNLILRCTWTYKLSAHLRHNYLTVFTITALEIFRRFQWVFFRVENEWNKMNSRSNTPPSINNLTTEADKLLGV